MFLCVWACVCVCLLKVSYAPPSSQIPLALLTYSHQNTITRTHRHSENQHTSHPPYCQDCVYVGADNTTGLNPSTCDFLQTGLVPVSPLNSPWNTGKSRAAGWSTGRGPNPLFHVLNTLLLLSKWTAMLWMWSTSISHFSSACRDVDRKAELNTCMTREHTPVNVQQWEKYANPVPFHIHINTTPLT